MIFEQSNSKIKLGQLDPEWHGTLTEYMKEDEVVGTLIWVPGVNKEELLKGGKYSGQN